MATNYKMAPGGLILFLFQCRYTKASDVFFLKQQTHAEVFPIFPIHYIGSNIGCLKYIRHYVFAKTRQNLIHDKLATTVGRPLPWYAHLSCCCLSWSSLSRTIGLSVR